MPHPAEIRPNATFEMLGPERKLADETHVPHLSEIRRIAKPNDDMF